MNQSGFHGLSAKVVLFPKACFCWNCTKVADGQQAKKAASPMTAVCRSFAQMAIEMGQQSMLRSLKPLRSALEKLQDTPEAEQLFKEMKSCSKTSNHEDSVQIWR